MNKIVFSDGKMFDTAAYPVELEPPIIAKKIAENGANQDYLRITLSATYADVLAYFVDNATYAIRQFDIGKSGEELETYTDFDWSEYSVAKDIVDHRDGRVTVYMAKPNEQEQVAEALKIIYGE